MLAIRLQRVGRKSYAQYRIIVQEAQRSPSSGRVIANLGNFNPHTNEVTVDKTAAETYLKNGAQPSDRVARLLKAEKIKLPAWVDTKKGTKKRSTKQPDKLRKNRPKETEEPVEEVSVEATEEKAKPEKDQEPEKPEASPPEEDDSSKDEEKKPEAEGTEKA